MFEEPRAGLGQTLSTGSPIVGTRASPYRKYCGQPANVQDAVPLAATADESGNVKVSEEDGFLSRNVTIKANNRIAKERSEFGAVKKTQPTAGKKKGTAKSRQKKTLPTAGKKKRKRKRKKIRAFLDQSCCLQGCISACVSRHWRVRGAEVSP